MQAGPLALPMPPRMELTTRIESSLSGLRDWEVDQLTLGASAWFDRRWFRLLDAVELPALLRGELAFRYVVVRRGQAPVAVCPFLVTRSGSIYFFYSLEKYFFTAWQEELLRLHPESRRWIRGVSAVVEGYRRLAWLLKSGLEGWVLAVSPLTYRGGIAQAPGSPEEVRAVRGAVLEALEEVAREERLPLCFYGLDAAEQPLRQALRESGFHELFLFYDSRIDIDFQSLNGYLAHFEGRHRRKFRHEMRQVEELGYRFERLEDFGRLGSTLERFYEATYSKYGEDHFHQPASFWPQVERHLGSMVETLVAWRGGQPKGFVTLIERGDEVWAWRSGRTPEEGEKENPIYFHLAFYEPLKRALARGASRLWLGPGAWGVKRRRGARGQPIHGYLWFPRRLSRAVLLPYLSTFSRISQQQLSQEVEPPSPPEAPRAPRRAPSPPAAPAPEAAHPPEA